MAAKNIKGDHMNSWQLALFIVALIFAVIAWRSPSLFKSKGVLTGIVSVVALVLLVLFFTYDANAQRAEMRAWIDYPLDGQAIRCIDKGDQTQSDIDFMLKGGCIYGYCGVVSQYHKSCAGNDDARGQSFDATRAGIHKSWGKPHVTVLYGDDNEWYGSAGYTLITRGQANADVAIVYAGEPSIAFGLTWKFDRVRWPFGQD